MFLEYFIALFNDYVFSSAMFSFSTFVKLQMSSLPFCRAETTVDYPPVFLRYIKFNPIIRWKLPFFVATFTLRRYIIFNLFICAYICVYVYICRSMYRDIIFFRCMRSDSRSSNYLSIDPFLAPRFNVYECAWLLNAKKQRPNFHEFPINGAFVSCDFNGSRCAKI